VIGEEEGEDAQGAMVCVIYIHYLTPRRTGFGSTVVC
jgi:hypothetical protein